EGAEPYEFTQEPEPLMAADQQLNGRITLAAFLRTVDRRFDSLDKAHTGSIALADLPRTPSQPAEPPKGGRGKRPSGAEQGPPRDR
ncbi:MAG: hypothetical protein P4L64_07130, partial [Caulobacteraceae bacterium]|nr:hypothetical protein [Caulobacteraceae bacterium]